MKYYDITRAEIVGDVWNWSLTPEELLANVNPDELRDKLPEMLASKGAENGAPLDRVVRLYEAAAAVVALARTAEEDWEEVSKMIPRELLYDCWDISFNVLGKDADLTLFLDYLDEWEGE